MEAGPVPWSSRGREGIHTGGWLVPPSLQAPVPAADAARLTGQRLVCVQVPTRSLLLPAVLRQVGLPTSPFRVDSLARQSPCPSSF